MEAVIRLTESLEFRIWRWLFLVLMTAWTIILLVFKEFSGLGTTYLCLWTGVLPCTVFMLFRWRRPKLAVWLAYGYDLAISLALALVLALRWEPSDYGFLPFFLMAGFIVEGILLTAVLTLEPELWLRFAYVYDACVMIVLAYAFLRLPDPILYIPAVFVIIECTLLTLALARANRRASPVS